MAPKSKRSDRMVVYRRCLICFQAPGNLLLKCGKCKSAWYCSRECQKSDWPDHKKGCFEPTEITAALPRLVRNFIAARPLLSFLPISFAHDFRLDRFPCPDRGMFAICVLVVQPFDLVRHLELLEARSRGEYAGHGGSEWSAEGVLQMKAFIPVPGHVMTEVEQRIWDEMKGKGGDADHAAVVRLVVEGCNTTGTCTGTLINPETIEAVRENKPVLSYPEYPQVNFPPSSRNCIKAVNLLIRRDTENKMGLRTSFTRETALKLNEDWYLLDYTPSL